MFDQGRQILALTAALLLAFPSGWCCLAPACAKRDPARPASACCPAHHRAPSGGTPEKEPAPARLPACECPSVTPLAPTSPTVDASSLAPILVAVVGAPEPAAAPTQDGLPTRASLPSLHLLHHVWLC